MKKLAILMLVLCMLPLAGLAESTYPAMPRGDLSNMPISEEKIELEVWTIVTADVEDMETNEMTKMYEELTNVHVNWIVANSSDSAQQLNLSLASGDYPDIYMCGFSTDQIVSYGMGEGVFIPLEDLIEEHAPNMKAILDADPRIKEKITAPDGHIYTFYRFDGTQSPFSRLWIFQPWLKAYTDATGNGEPQTLAEFRTMLEYFRDHDMNGNGDATDEIPLLGTYAWDHEGSDPMYWIMNCFTLFPSNLLYVKDGQAVFAPTGDAYREGLKFVRELVKDGLLDEVTYTQDLNQYRAVVNVTEEKDMKVGVAAAPYYMRFVTQSIYADAYEDFYFLAPVEGPTGLRQTDYKQTGSILNWVITSAYEDPVAAIKWLDYLTTPYMVTYANLGDEGTDWVFNGEYNAEFCNAPVIERFTTTLNAEGSTTQNRRWTGWLSRIFLPDGYRSHYDLPTTLATINSAAASETYMKYAVNVGIPEIVWTTDEDLALEDAELATQITDYAANMWTQFILGTIDINDDAQWEAYEKGLQNYGLERWLEIKAEMWGLN